MSSRSTYVAVDGVEFDFRPRRAAKISLIVCPITSFAALVYLIRAGVCWVEFSTGEVVVLALTAIAWSVFCISCLVTIYARSLPPTETWLWEATKRVIASLSLLWFSTFCLCVTLTSRVFYHALRCSPSSGECTDLSHRIAVEVYASSAVSLAIALATTIFVSIDLHVHRWLGLFPTPRPAEQGWSSRPLLPIRRDGGGAALRNSGRRRSQPVFDYSDEEDSQSPFEDSPRPPPSRAGIYPASTSTSYPPTALTQSFITRAKMGLPLTPSLTPYASFPSAPSFSSSSEPSFPRQSSQLPPPPRYSTISQGGAFDVGTFFSPGKHDSSTRHRHGGSTSDETAPSTRTSGTSRPSETETEEDTEEEEARIKAEEEKRARRRRRAARRKEARKKAGSSHHHHHHHSSDSSSHHDDERYKRKRKQAGVNATSSGAQSAVNSALLNSSGGGGDAGGGASAS